MRLIVPMSVVKNFSDHVAVMYLGKFMETAPTQELFANPLHPYTRALLSAIPVVTDEELKLIPQRITLEGEIPSPANVSLGCVFHTRCYAHMGGLIHADYHQDFVIPKASFTLDGEPVMREGEIVL